MQQCPPKLNHPLRYLDGLEAVENYRGLDRFEASQDPEPRSELPEARLERWEKRTAKWAAFLVLFSAIWTGLFLLWASKDTFGSWVDYLNIFAWAVVGPAAVTAALDIWDRLKPSSPSKRFLGGDGESQLGASEPRPFIVAAQESVHDLVRRHMEPDWGSVPAVSAT